MKDKRVALIDADGLIYICVHNKKLYNLDKTPILNELGEQCVENKTFDDCRNQLDSIISNILKFTKSTHYLMFLTIGRNFRYNIFPEYKANRKYGDKPEHFDAIKDYIKTGMLAIYHFEYEADDLVRMYQKKLGECSFIASPDKDILALEGTHLNYNKFEWVTNNKKEADYKFWCSVITGDTVDNIKGIPGKGIKFAEKLISNDIALQQGITNPQIVLYQYIDKFGEENGIEEFYKNYKCLKIVDECEGLEFQEPIEITDEYKLIE